VLREVFAFQDAARRGGTRFAGAASGREYIEFRELDLTSAEDYWRTFLASFTAPTPSASTIQRATGATGTDSGHFGARSLVRRRPRCASRRFTERDVNTLLQAAGDRATSP
jgi:hypothetical protein